MRISDWSSDVCSSDLSGFCLTDRATWQGGQDSAEQYQSPWPHFPLPSRDIAFEVSGPARRQPTRRDFHHSRPSTWPSGVTNSSIVLPSLLDRKSTRLNSSH